MVYIGFQYITCACQSRRREVRVGFIVNLLWHVLQGSWLSNYLVTVPRLPRLGHEVLVLGRTNTVRGIVTIQQCTQYQPQWRSTNLNRTLGNSGIYMEQGP
jgi:hypothetical protein